MKPAIVLGAFAVAAIVAIYAAFVGHMTHNGA